MSRCGGSRASALVPGWFWWWVGLCAALVAVLIALNGCALMLTGTTDPGKIQAIMDSTHARGCVYGRASASPWASVVTYVVGTFGDPVPSLDECWSKIPPSSP